jgi:hypothetical protein
MHLPEFHDVFRAILGWNGDLGYTIRVHGQEFNSFRRKTRSKALHEFKLHRQEKFLYICDTLHMWSGTSASWTFRTASKATTGPSVWGPRRCATGVLRRSDRLPADAEAATRGRRCPIRSGWKLAFRC